jgi:glutathione S-transferase
MIRLWGRPSSVNVQKALWALDELGEPFEHIIVGGRYGGIDTPEFRALTPIPRVPVLQDGDLTLWESHAIVRHLARTKGAPLAPAERDWAIADQWMDYVTSTVQPTFIRLFWHLVRTKPEDRDDARLPALRKALSAALGPIEARLGSSEWLAGDAFSMAEIAAGSMFYRAKDLCDPFDGNPNIAQWYSQITRRPAYVKTVMTSYEELRA